MDQVLELREITYTHAYSFSLKTLTWATLAVVAVMGALFFVVGFPPAFDNYFEKMYFHAVGIGIAALAVYLVLDVYKLQQYEPPMDFPISYRAFLAAVFAALGGLVYLTPSLSNNTLPDIGLLLFTVAFVLIGDVGGALLIELFLMPRKKLNIYCCESHTAVDYFGRVLPLRPVDRNAYKGLGAPYWLTLAAIAAAFVAGIAGFVNLWVRIFGASIFSGYISWLGIDAKGLQDATLDPHSHLIALAIMAGIVGVATVQFGILDSESKVRRLVARVGLWVTILGVVATTAVLGAAAFLNFSPPTLFENGPSGMASDDMIMTIIGLGAMIVVAPMLMDRRVKNDLLRLTILGTWIAAVLINVLEGFYIELHEDQFAGAMAANDASFSVAQPMTGIFLLIVISLALLLVDHYGIEGRNRRIVAWTSGIGLIAALVGVTLWTFNDPSNSGISFGIYMAGTAIAYLGVLLASIVVRSIKVGAFDRTYP